MHRSQGFSSAEHTDKSSKSNADFLADQYLANLLSYSLEALSKEPGVLKSQQEALQQEIKDTATKHYQGFVHAADCFKDVSGQVQQVQTQLQGLATDIQALQANATSFSQVASSYQGKHELNRALLSQHSTVLELLEVPQLIDTCVRNSNYDEALDLVAFVNKLAIVNSGSAVAARLVHEVALCRGVLLEQLQATLCRNVMLPECLRCVSYLRRLGAFSEPELRLQFLQCREQWLQGIVDAIDDGSVVDYLRQLTDTYRLHLFDVVMQYRAIFFEADTADVAKASPAGEVPAASMSRVLYSWALHRVLAYVERLEQCLPLVRDGNSLAAVIEGCLYCGKSLSRVGLDFRGLLTPAISQAVLALFSHHMARAVAMFASSLDMHKWMVMPVAKRKAAAEAQGEGGDSSGESVLGAAYGLMSHPPLAVFINAVIGALNAIRSTALLAVCSAAAGEVQSAVREACAMLAHVPATRDLSPSEASVHLDACRAMSDTVCPLMLRLFSQVFSSKAAVLPDLADVAAPLLSRLQDAAATAASAPPASIATTTAGAPAPAPQTPSPARQAAADPPQPARPLPQKREAPVDMADSPSSAPVQARPVHTAGNAMQAPTEAKRPEPRAPPARAAAAVPASAPGAVQATVPAAPHEPAAASQRASAGDQGSGAPAGKGVPGKAPEFDGFGGFHDEEEDDDGYDESGW